jgi:hypothetical protein
MQRRKTQPRKARAMAGALALAAFSATAAIGANLGLFGLTQDGSGVGRLNQHHEPVSSAPAGSHRPAAPNDGRLADD